MPLPPRRPRGTLVRPPSRFAAVHVERDPGDEADGRAATRWYRDASRTILARNDSPDVPFTWSLNPYRGCEHGCTYCYARPSHEYLGFDAGLDFEQRIVVKEDAPALLRQTLASPRWRPQPIALSGNTDCYQPLERRLCLTRACLAILAECRNPVSIITKSALVVRDLDLLAPLAAVQAVHVCVSITTLDAELARRMEPRAAEPRRRLATLETLASAGIPTACVVGPVIPGLNDSEIPAILAAAREAGCRSASWVLLRLPRPVDQVFAQWLADQLPLRRARVLARIRDTRAGRLNDARFGWRKRGEGPYAAQIAALFAAAARRHDLHRPLPPLSTAAFRPPAAPESQLRLL